MQWSGIHSIRQSHITFHHITATTTRTTCRFGKLCGPKVSLPRTWLFLTCFWLVSDPFLTCFWPLYVSSMCEHSMCEHPMCEHSICDHSMWPLYVSRMCGEHDVWALYVWALYVSTNTEKYENYQEKWTSVLGPDVAEHRKVRELRRKLDFSSWAECCGITEKYENYHENSTSVLGPDVAAPKTSKKHEFYCKNPVQKHCGTPKSSRITTKAEHRRSWRAEKVRKFTDETRFRPFQEHRRTPKSTTITTKNEHRRSWRAGHYENLQTKPVHAGRRQAETTKIHRRNEHASTKPRK